MCSVNNAAQLPAVDGPKSRGLYGTLTLADGNGSGCTVAILTRARSDQ